MRVVLLAAPPGTGLREVCSKLVDQAGEDSLAIVDVEDVLLDDLALTAEFASPRQAPHTLADVVESVTRTRFLDLWKRAIQKALDTLRESNATTKCLSCHLSIFNFRRSEHFLTPVASAILAAKDVEVDRVVLFIDDIFDMFSRLQQDDSPLCDVEHEASFQLAQKTGSIYIENARNDLPSVDLRRLTVQAETIALQRLLRWRRLDMIAAESLGGALSCGVHAFGVKHPIAHVIRIISSGSSVSTVYLSHPVSRARVKMSSTHDREHWPEIVQELEYVSEQLLTRACVATLPSSIDEYRFPHIGDTGLYSGADVMPYARWPFSRSGSMWSDVHASNNYLISDQDDEVCIAFRRILEAEIGAEVAFRDHYLVNHAQHLIVYRPMYVAGRFSAGVRAEVSHWEGHADGHLRRRAVFIHSLPEVLKHLEMAALDKDRLQHEIRTCIEESARQAGLNIDEASNLVDDLGHRRSLLDRGRSSLSNLSRDDALLAGISLFLYRRLTSLEAQSGSELLLISPDDLRSDEVIDKAAAFFDGRIDGGIDFLDNCLDRSLPGGRIGWAKAILSDGGGTNNADLSS